MYHYETVFIVSSTLSKDQSSAAFKKYVDALKEKKAEIVHKETMGTRPLAYDIKGSSSGTYYLIEFQSNESCIKSLHSQYNQDEQILRYLTVSLDQHSIAYSQRRREQMKQAKEKAAEEANKEIDETQEEVQR